MRIKSIKKSKKNGLASVTFDGSFQPIDLQQIRIDGELVITKQAKLTQLYIDEVFAFMNTKLKEGNFVDALNIVDTSKYGPLALFKILRIKFNSQVNPSLTSGFLSQGEKYFLESSIAFLYSVLAIGFAIVDLVINKTQGTFKIKSWNQSKISKLLQELSTYDFKPTQLLVYTGEVQRIVSTYLQFDFSKEELEQIIQGFNVGDIAADLTPVVSKTLTSLDQVFREQLLRLNIAQGNLDRLSLEHLVEGNVPGLVFERFDFGFRVFEPAVVARRVRAKVVQKPVAKVLQTPSPVIEKDPRVNSMVLASTLDLLDRLSDLQTDIPFLNDLFAVAYYEVLPTREQMIENYKLIQQVSTGSFIPAPVTTSQEFSDEQLHPEYLETLRSQATAIAQSIKQDYKSFIKKY